MSRQTKLAILSALAAGSLSATALAGDAFLKMGDIKGESVDRGHKDWIPVESISWATSDASDAAGEFWFVGLDPGMHRGPDRADKVARKADKASPSLTQATNIGKAKADHRIRMHRRLADGTPLLVVRGHFDDCRAGQRLPQMTIASDEGAWTLRRVRIEGCAQSAPISGDSDDRPTEEVAFYYNKIAFSYGGKSAINKHEIINKIQPPDPPPPKPR